MGFDQSAKLNELLAVRGGLETALKTTKSDLAKVNAAISEVVMPTVNATLSREGKPHGTVHFTIGNHGYKATVEQRVEWNTSMLASIAPTLDPVLAATIFKVEYSVPEAVFKAVEDGDLKKRLTAARTVKYSEPKIAAE
jgi:hypothetical protein